MLQPGQFKDVKYGTVPSSSEADLLETMRIKRDGRVSIESGELKDDYPLREEFPQLKSERERRLEMQTNRWAGVRRRLAQFFTRERLVAVAFWMIAIVFIALIIARIVLVEKRRARAHHD
jgi:hypothetical protein